MHNGNIIKPEVLVEDIVAIQRAVVDDPSLNREMFLRLYQENPKKWALLMSDVNETTLDVERSNSIVHGIVLTELALRRRAEILEFTDLMGNSDEINVLLGKFAVLDEV